MTREDGGLPDAVELGEQLLGQVVAQVGQGQAHAQEQPQHPSPERRQVGVLGENGLAQVHNLDASDPRATTLSRLRHQNSPKSNATLLSDTHPFKTF